MKAFIGKVAIEYPNATMAVLLVLSVATVWGVMKYFG